MNGTAGSVLSTAGLSGDLCVESPYRTGLGGEENSIVTGTGKF